MDEPTIQRAVFLQLPVNKPINIYFENINYKKGKKSLLQNISGSFKSGELTAIMGPSGAGKTTLLNILTGFEKENVTGRITTNWSKRDNFGAEQYKKDKCYILQNDELTPYFTVNEAMKIATDLKLGKSLSDNSKTLLIDGILTTLALSSCTETMTSKLSGGQKKRLSIALELIDNPPIMFLDEPTTGLDSSSSLQCIKMLKTLAKGGRTIVITIHQPSASMYEMFDHVYTMAQGLCVYKGASLNTVAYLSNLGYVCPEYHNPADYLLEITSLDNSEKIVSKLSQATNDEIWRYTLTAPLGKKTLLAEIEEEINVNNNLLEKNGDMPRGAVLINPPSEWNKFIILINRTLLHLYRDWTVTHLKLALHTLIGILIGLFYYNIGNDASKIFSNVSYFCVSCVYLTYTSMMPGVLKLPSELPVLRKERFNNWYNLKTYYLALMAADIPIQIIFSLFYSSISYYMTSQPLEWNRFGMFVIICMLLTVSAESVGIFLGTIANPINGTFFGAISIAVVLSLAGFLLFLNHMTPVFYAISYSSYIRYAIEGLVYSVYDQRSPLECPEEEIYCHYVRSEIFLDEVGMTHINIWLNVTALFVFNFVLRVITYFTLKRTLSKN